MAERHDPRGGRRPGAQPDGLRGQTSVPAPGQVAPGRLTASIGVAVIGEELATAEELLVHADLATYDAKQEGSCGRAGRTRRRSSGSRTAGG